MPIFAFPGEPHWSEELDAAEFEIVVGEYHGRVTCSRRQLAALGASRDPADCLAFLFAHRPWFEKAAEMKVELRELAADGNIELTSRDLRRVWPS